MASNSGFNIRFPGQYQDAETGLHYNRFRYYDPAIGRYISADPIGQFGFLWVYDVASFQTSLRALDLARPFASIPGHHLYLYVDGNPLVLIDPSGLGPRSHIVQGVCTAAGRLAGSSLGFGVAPGCFAGAGAGILINTTIDAFFFEETVNETSEGAQQLFRERYEEIDRLSDPDADARSPIPKTSAE